MHSPMTTKFTGRSSIFPQCVGTSVKKVIERAANNVLGYEAASMMMNPEAAQIMSRSPGGVIQSSSGAVALFKSGVP